MEVHYFPYSLAFKYPFKLSHTSRTHTDNVYLLLEKDRYKAWGETVFIPYYPENLEAFQDLLYTIDLPEQLTLGSLKAYSQELNRSYPETPFCIAGIDAALHQLLALEQGTTIAQLYGIEGLAPDSSFTLGISDKELMQQKIEENPEVTYFKLKVDQENIARIIEDYSSLSSKPFVVDANQGFQDRTLALEWAQRLHELGVAYLEQPFDKSDWSNARWLKERSPLPIIADEAFQKLEDVPKVKEAFDGINIKLMKCGGITAAYELFQEAQKHQLKTVLGCMAESTVGTEAAYHLAPLADWIDLDGPLLIANDLFSEDAELSDAERIEILKRQSE